MIDIKTSFFDLKFLLYFCHSRNPIIHKGMAYEYRQDLICSGDGFSSNLRI
jgi:hypothetical protein